MAKVNQVIENKTFGDRIKFLVTAEASGGALLRAELYVKPGGEGPPLHYHPVQSETFTVVKGEMNILCNGQQVVLRAGENYCVPPNTPHKFWNGSNSEAVAVIDLKPALKTEFSLETLYSLDVQGKTNKKTGLPGLLQFAAILHECYGEIFMVDMPVPLQKFIAKVIGRFAKNIGYKGYVPFPEN